MSEKEKARELFDKFVEFGWESKTDSRITRWNTCQMIITFIDEIIKELNQVDLNYDLESDHPDTCLNKTTIPYWERVKDEITIICHN